MIRPVGVGRISRGPIGVDGLTMTGGQIMLFDQAQNFLFGHIFRPLIGADQCRQKSPVYLRLKEARSDLCRVLQLSLYRRPFLPRP